MIFKILKDDSQKIFCSYNARPDDDSYLRKRKLRCSIWIYALSYFDYVLICSVHTFTFIVGKFSV